MQKPFFSIVVVALNPGERLKETLDSIGNQTFQDYEVILKDGGSTDGSLEKLQQQGYFDNKKQIVIQQKKDKSIYDGMNQAVSFVKGRYVQFLNCGDYFYSDTVLEEVAEFIESERRKRVQASLSNQEFSIEAVEQPPVIFYGNQYNRQQDTTVYSAPEINDFTCYRNVPCHQVCFYDYRLFEKRAYDLKYKVRADYEHFLYSIYEESAAGISMPVMVVSYEGGGFSETKENRKRSAMEHKEITSKYLGKGKVFKYRCIMWLTLAPLRTMIAESPALSGGYNAIKNTIYRWLKK
ncbi:MAG: glycosyltransferase [Lachnospiraceae bacterium]|nr:glycosyltransferase [Lachnospiraceae bacterium]